MKNALLIKFLLKESTLEESEKVESWINATEENKKKFLQLETIWQGSKALQINNPKSEEVAWQNFIERKEKLVDKLNAGHKILIYPTWLKIAAVLLIGLFGLVTYHLLNNFKYTELASNNKVQIERLPDGSSITLNKNARISYAGNFKSNRLLKMEKGEVFFEVMKDKNHPFVIDIDQVSVAVVGTSFNVKILENNTQINVESGIVKVSLGADDITLFKGEQILIEKGSKKLVKEKNTDQLYQYYRTKLFHSNNIKLAKLILTLNEAYGSHISLDDRSKALTISTTLRVGSLDDNLQIICETLNLTQSRNGNSILLSYQDK